MDQVEPMQLLAEVEELIRSAPNNSSQATQCREWLGSVSAALQQALPRNSDVDLFLDATRLRGGDGMRKELGYYSQILVSLHRARRLLQWATKTPTGVVIESGNQFDYFDSIRKIIEQAKQEILFVDPYMDAEFVSRYLKPINSTVRIRLLTWSNIDSVLPAIELLSNQSGISVEIRSSNRIHDRFIFVDRESCHMSGASFKDGAKRAPTIVAKITDAFDALLECYEEIWNSSTKVH